MRVHVCAVRMTLQRADVLEAYLNGQDIIQKATVYERTGDVVLTYRGSRKDAAALLAAYRFDNEELEVLVTSHDSRKINQEYQEKMVNLVAGRVFRKVFLPAPIAAAYTVWRSIAFVWKGIRCLLHRKLEVEVLDALSITASLLRGDYSTAGSVMFLLTVGSLLEEWTRKKSLDDLARSMALNVDKVWVRTPQGEVLVPLTRVHAGDEVVVRSGNMIPLDGMVLEGEAMVNQAALTGESMPVRKTIGATVYAGTVVEEGECVFTAKAEGGGTTADPTKPSGGFLTGIAPETSVKSLNDSGYTVYSGKQEVTSGYVGTGMTAISGSTSLAIVVTGDVNGDGRITITDVVKLQNYAANAGDLDGAAMMAGDINGDGRITITDVVQAAQVTVGQRTI